MIEILKIASFILASLTGLDFTSIILFDWINHHERTSDENTHVFMSLISSVLLWVWVFI